MPIKLHVQTLKEEDHFIFYKELGSLAQDMNCV